MIVLWMSPFAAPNSHLPRFHVCVPVHVLAHVCVRVPISLLPPGLLPFPPLPPPSSSIPPPQGLHRDWLYSHPEGQWELVKSANALRLIIVSLVIIISRSFLSIVITIANITVHLWLLTHFPGGSCG